MFLADSSPANVVKALSLTLFGHGMTKRSGWCRANGGRPAKGQPDQGRSDSRIAQPGQNP